MLRFPSNSKAESTSQARRFQGLGSFRPAVVVYTGGTVAETSRAEREEGREGGVGREEEEKGGEGEGGR